MKIITGRRVYPHDILISEAKFICCSNLPKFQTTSHGQALQERKFYTTRATLAN